MVSIMCVSIFLASAQSKEQDPPSGEGLVTSAYREYGGVETEPEESSGDDDTKPHPGKNSFNAGGGGACTYDYATHDGYPDDDAGHILANQLGGRAEPTNLFPQAP